MEVRLATRVVALLCTSRLTQKLGRWEVEPNLKAAGRRRRLWEKRKKQDLGGEAQACGFADSR